MITKPLSIRFFTLSNLFNKFAETYIYSYYEHERHNATHQVCKHLHRMPNDSQLLFAAYHVRNHEVRNGISLSLT